MILQGKGRNWNYYWGQADRRKGIAGFMYLRLLQSSAHAATYIALWVLKSKENLLSIFWFSTHSWIVKHKSDVKEDFCLRVQKYIFLCLVNRYNFLMKMSQQHFTNKNEVLLMYHVFSSSVQWHAQKIKTNIQILNFLFFRLFYCIPFKH